MRPTCSACEKVPAPRLHSMFQEETSDYWQSSFIPSLFHPKTIADPEWPIVVTVLPPLASRLGSLGRAVPPGRQCPPNCNVTKRNFLRLRNLHSCEACSRLSSCLTLGCLALACLPNTSSTTFRSRSSRLVASPAAKEIATLSIFVFRLLRTLAVSCSQ